ncbi:MAG TPA: 4'-phosphopantetheinyl transferase superfamily protein [Polyangia bacterium]|jgi:Phosphopantetheinyl transferase|nr:4'-phosphopantetheinyl transferase superfamily protein [Polyangia bacterium]
MFRHVLAQAGEHPALELGQAPPGLLGPREEAILAGLALLPRRRKWLLGRWAAKRLLGELAAEDNDLVTGLLGKPGSDEDWRRQFGILNDDAGAPYVDRQRQGKLPLALSISHRGDWGLAAVALSPGARIGADLETVEPRDPALVRQFFSESEADRVAKANGSDVDRTVARIWSAKESVLKAMGLGLRHDTRDIVVGDEIAAPAGAPEAWRALDIRLAPVLAARIAPRSLSLLWRDLDAHVITVALLM